MRTRHPLAAALLRLLPAVAVLACGAPEEPASAAPPPSIVLIVVDTLRADHLESYGYERATSPHIDSLAASSTLYRNAIATAPWTVPSHASMFTGRFPFEHGAHTAASETRPGATHALHPDNVTLAEVLRDDGFQTAAFVANQGFLDPHYGLNQGFQSYFVKRMNADLLNRHIFDWLEQTARAPFFLFINYMDTHRPYNTKPRRGLTDTAVVRDEGELLDSLAESVLPARAPAPPDLVRQVVDQYDTAIANVDEQVGALVVKLIALGIFDSSVVVLTSDHGEYFGEHQLVAHSKDVYQEALRVPLLVKAPGQQRQGRVVDTPASLVDLPWLILQALPDAIADRHRQHFPRRPGNHALVAENYYARAKDMRHPIWGARFDRVRRAIFDWPYKYIHSSDGRHELYNLGADPTEQVNLADRDHERRSRLSDELAQLIGENEDQASEPLPAEPNPQLQRELKALGYLPE